VSPNIHGKSIDKTYLSLDKAEERLFLHRDYIAHCLRWTHIVKYLQEKQRYKTAWVLDIGCGKEAPLIKTLYTSRLLPAFYVGIDVGPIVPGIDFSNHPQVVLMPELNAIEITPESSYDLIVMFEVLEHVEKAAGIELLAHIYKFMGPNTVFFMSTPCYNGKDKAGNHVYEWVFDELQDQLQDLGFLITNAWGTFASIRDYKHLLNEGELHVFNKLSNYYDVNYLSTIFAPLYPAHSRNCLWQLVNGERSSTN
jgi:hypothetical protein